MVHKMRSTIRKSRRGSAAVPSPAYDLRLYVSGMTPRSTFAIENVRAVCEEYLPGHYHLQIIDIYQNPSRMWDDQVVAVPTLVKRRPRPVKLLVGDMSNRERMLSGLNLKAK